MSTRPVSATPSSGARSQPSRDLAPDDGVADTGRVLINPAQCPLRSESDWIAASPRNDAMCQKPTKCIAANSILFDHFVGDLLEVHGYVEAQRFGSLEVDNKLILCRRLHRHVGRLLALEDAVDVPRGAPVHVDPIRPIGEQATGGDEGALEIDCGELMPRRKG